MVLLLFIIGSLVAPYLPILPSLVWALSGVFMALGLAVFSRATLLSSWLLGLSLSVCHLHWLQNTQLPETGDGRDYSLEIIIDSLPEVRPKSSVFMAKIVHIDSVTGDDLSFSLQKIRLSWYGAPELKPGQVWQLTARLKRPRGFVNPHGFDYQAWLMSQKIGATGYVRQRQGTALLGTEFNTHQLRQRVVQYIDRSQLENPIASSIIKALSVGERSGLTVSAWQTLKRTGTVHLMAISGLHIGLVASLAYAMGIFLARSMAVLEQCCLSSSTGNFVIRWLPSILSCALATFYGAMAGFSIPTQRALIVVVLANVALLCQRRVNPFHLLALAGAFMCLLDPMLSFNPGFWLSFGAVVILLSLFCGRRPLPNRTKSLLSAQLLLSLGLLLPLLALGQTVSLIAPIANLVAVPLVSIIIVPLVLLGAITSLWELEIASLFFQISAWFIEWLWRYLEWLSAATWATWWPSRPLDNAWLVVGILGVVLCFIPRGLTLKLLSIPLLLIILIPIKSTDYQLKLSVLDVGQGLASVLRVPGQTMVYDTGPRLSPRFDAGSRILVPFLQAEGIHSLDTLLISHGDLDHSGGAIAVLEAMDVKQTLLSQNQDVYKDYGVALKQCLAGQQWRLGPAELRVLWPLQMNPESEGLYSPNNRSCVLLLRMGEVQILMPGDIELEVEHNLLELGLLPRDITVLIAPHHGSKTSSSAAFVAHLNPQYVVFSAGYKGRYGHPHSKVVERYRRLGSQILNTATDGALTFAWDIQGQLKLERARVDSARFWISKD